MRYTFGAIDSPIDLDWDEIANYGTDSEEGICFLNRDGTCDYAEINDPVEIKVYEVRGWVV